MPIRPPALDDRSFEDLRAELIRRIPAHTPEWTNPRQGDPGVTLLELFAWLADTILYRANLIPERQRLVFLSLLGQNPLPARAARGLVAIETEQVKAVTLAAGAAIKGPVNFETLTPASVLPVTGEVYRKRPLSDDESTAMSEFVNG